MRILVVGRQYLPHFVLDFACQRLEEKRLRQLPSFLPKKSPQLLHWLLPKLLEHSPFPKNLSSEALEMLKLKTGNITHLPFHYVPAANCADSIKNPSTKTIWNFAMLLIWNTFIQFNKLRATLVWNYDRPIADCPAMSFLLVCWQIEIPIWISWVGQSTNNKEAICESSSFSNP